MVPSMATLAPTFVHSPALATIQAWNYAFTELTPCSIIPRLAPAGVPLDTVAPIEAGEGADPPLTPPALETSWAVTHSWSRAAAPIHTLRGTHCHLAQVPFPSWSADTVTTGVTVAPGRALPGAQRIWAEGQTLLPEPQLEWSACQLSSPGHDLEANGKGSNTSEVSSTGQ